MSTDFIPLIKLLHLIAVIFMAAPLYMLIVSNERARFAVPPGYNTDRYMENILRSQPQRCYAYLAMVLVSGAFLLYQDGGLQWGLLVSNWALAIKVIAFALISSLITYVHLAIQPKVDHLLDTLKPGESLPENLRPQLGALRMRRKRLSAFCLFLVLTSVIMGVRVFSQYNIYLMALFLVLAAIFAWRVFKTPLRYGWY